LRVYEAVRSTLFPRPVFEAEGIPPAVSEAEGIIVAEFSPEHIEETQLLAKLIDTAQARRDTLAVDVERLRLGRGRKWKVPPRDEWPLPREFREFQQAPRTEPPTWMTKIKKWEWFGDCAADLYAYLVKFIPAERKVGLSADSLQARPFQQQVLRVVGKLMTNY